ncbi:MAG: glutaredoxin 3 [Hyphomicrobiales bacterium]|nr:MAG: glutaredoxin 3 [Hyphomicrobiales bacterium]
MPDVVIYTRKFCGYCTAAKRLLAQKGVDFNEIDATGDPAKRDEMIARSSGGSTFPQIFIGEKHIGGCDELYALDRAGGLDPLLNA